jgi:hypothetical protein
MRQQLKNIFGPLTQPGVRWFIPGFILLTAALSLFILHVDINSYKEYAKTVPMHREVDALNTLHAEKMNAIFNGEFIENFNFTFRGIDTFIVPPPISIFDLTSSYGTITRGNIQAGGPIEIDDVIIDIFRLHTDNFIDTFTGAIFIMGGIIFLIFGFLVFYLKENAAFLEAGKLKATFFSKAAAAEEKEDNAIPFKQKIKQLANDFTILIKRGEEVVGIPRSEGKTGGYRRLLSLQPVYFCI